MPSFQQNIQSTTSFTCYNSNLTLFTNALNANSFIWQISQNGTWLSVESGTINASPTRIEKTFFNLIEPLTVRVYLKNGLDSVFSNEITISPHRPVINIEPIDLIQCNGLDVDFRTGATGQGTITYQWQSSNNGGSSFSNLSNTTKYAGTNTPSLRVNNLVNGDHNFIFRCFIKDQNQCENLSQNASLFINQLSTSVSPTTSIIYCEDDTSKFFVALKIGSVSNMKWQLRKSSQSTYSDILPSLKYLGLNADTLTVKGIKPDERSYRLVVNFENKLQSASGNIVLGTCDKTATRANYTINPRPAKPLVLDSLSRCGPGVLRDTLLASQNYFWYTDTLSQAFLSNTNFYISPNLNSTRNIFYRQKSTQGCFSKAEKFKNIIYKIPEVFLKDSLNLCFGINNINLNVDSIKNSPLNINFTSINVPLFVNQNIGLNTSNILIPNTLSAGYYDLIYRASDQNCVSSPKNLNFFINPETNVTLNPNSKILCEGSSFLLDPTVTSKGPTSFSWIKNTEISRDSILKIQNVMPQDSGVYRLIVSDICKIDTSNSFYLKVKISPKILEQPVSKEICEKDSVIFKVKAKGSGPLVFQWYRNDQIIPNATDSILTLKNVSISENQALFSCEVRADCEPFLRSNSVVLTVRPLPEPPNLLTILGFCQSEKKVLLPSSAALGSSTKWFLNNTQKDSLEINSPGSQSFKVKNVSIFGCISETMDVNTRISPSFTNTYTFAEDSVCATGIFNNKTNLEVEPNSTGTYNFSILKNGVLVDSNNTGSFQNLSAGTYAVVVKKEYCLVDSNFTIYPRNPELELSPVINDTLFCAGGSVNLSPKNLVAGSSVYWWANTADAFPLNISPSFTVNSSNSFYVSFVKNYSGGFCESNRTLFTVSLKGPLIGSSEVTPNTCISDSTGSVKITVTKGVGSLIFTKTNGQSNSTGIFTGLKHGFHLFQFTDSLGCTGSLEVNVPLSSGPFISSQPASVTKCKGNIANFSIQTLNQVQWQRKLPSEVSYSDMIGEVSPTLRIENIGNSQNPHNSLFRAKVSSGSNCFIFSDSAKLFVNSVSGNSLTQQICLGSDKNLDLSHFNIQGSINSYQWTKRPGTIGSFMDISGETSAILAISSAKKSNESYYSCRLVFEAGAGQTCTISTSSIASLRLIVDSLPQVKIYGSSIICKENSAVLVAQNCPNQALWSTGESSLSISVSPSQNTIYKAQCQSSSCLSTFKDSILVQVDNTPAALPINNTLPLIKEGEILTFSALGDSLRWYADSLSAIYSFQAPSFSAVGSYVYWVSQKSGRCESSRLKISASVFENLRITSSPQAFRNCQGNSANFQTIATGLGLKYKWQRKRPNESTFRDLSDTDANIADHETNRLSVYQIGKTDHPDSSLYRCKIIGSGDTLYTSAALLRVNILDGSLTNITKCIGQNLEIDLNNSHIIKGSPQTFQWQQREGTGSDWLNLKDTLNFSGVSTQKLKVSNLTELNAKQYRLRLEFNSSSGTCIESTDLMSLEIFGKPSKPENRLFEFCQNEDESWKIELANGLDPIWLSPDFQVTNKPKIDASYAHEEKRFYQVYYEKECPSEPGELNFVVYKTPNIPINLSPSLAEEDEGLKFNAAGTLLKWYNNSTTKTFATVSPIIYSVGKHDFFVTQTSEKGCESERLKIVAEVIAAFGIETQPKNQSVCLGNQAVFSLKIKGGQNPVYQWEVYNDNTKAFESLSLQTKPELKFTSDLNDEILKNGALIRCKVISGSKVIYSNSAKLNINSLSGKISDFALCEGKSLTLNFENFVVIGQTKNLFLQEKSGSSYNVIKTFSSTDSLIFESKNSGIFRLQYAFESGNTTCLRNSNDFNLKINKKPTPLTEPIEICEGVSIESQLPSLVFLNEPFDISKPPKQLSLKIKNELSCVSDPFLLDLNIIKKPDVNLIAESYGICLGQEFPSPPAGYNFISNLPESDDFKVGDLDLNMALKKEGNACASDYKKVKLKIQACSATENDNFCEQNLKTKNGFKWINSNNLLLAETNSLSSTLNVKIEKGLPVKIRLDAASNFDEDQEIKVYLPSIKTGQKLFFKYQEESFSEFCSEANSLECFTETASVVSEDLPYVMLKLKVNKIILLKYYDFEPITLSIENFTISANNYKNSILQKKSDIVDWFTLDAPFTKPFTEFKPFLDKNYYRAKVLLPDSVCYFSNVLETNNNANTCMVFANPLEKNDLIPFYFQGLDKNSISVSDIQGQQIKLDKLSENGDHWLLKTKAFMNPGSYVLNAISKSGLSCSYVFLVRP